MKKLGYICGSKHCRMDCVDGKCSPKSKIGFDVSQTDSKSTLGKFQQPNQPVEVKNLPVSAFFTEEQLNQVRTRIPEIDKILLSMCLFIACFRG